jgi:hypothetical protein
MMVFAGAVEGAQQAIVMWRNGSKRGSENIWRTKGRNLAQKEKNYGAQDAKLWRTTPDKKLNVTELRFGPE